MDDRAATVAKRGACRADGSLATPAEVLEVLFDQMNVGNAGTSRFIDPAGDALMAGDTSAGSEWALGMQRNDSFCSGTTVSSMATDHTCMSVDMSPLLTADVSNPSSRRAESPPLGAPARQACSMVSPRTQHAEGSLGPSDEILVTQRKPMHSTAPWKDGAWLLLADSGEDTQDLCPDNHDINDQDLSGFVVVEAPPWKRPGRERERTQPTTLRRPRGSSSSSSRQNSRSSSASSVSWCFRGSWRIPLVPPALAPGFPGEFAQPR